ncbi:O-antigen ligase family protein [Aestuariivirga sp.]|uniref:O-antigen ligase family protein n=1 Tax=Aestuariivirga sp. TaxID=2650926 RepID=UPI0035B24C5C
MTTGQEIPAVPALPAPERVPPRPHTLRRAMQHGRRISVTLLLDWVMTAFMIYVFVGGQLFEDRSQETLARNFASQGQGDTFRQFYYFTIFVIVGFITYRHDLMRKLRYYPMTINLMTMWCLATTFTAIEPAISFRRLVLSSIVVYTTFNLFICVGFQRSFELLRNVLALLMCASLVSVFIIPEAVHPATEADKALAGAWKGLFFHKNIAASMAANAIIVFVASYLNRRNLVDLLLIAVAVVFLSGTKGKTAPVLMILALGLGLFYRYSLGFSQRRTVYVAANALIAAGLSVGILLFQDKIIAILSDPESLTGRIAIWNLVADYVRQYPITGAGYGSFWQIGDQSPVFRLTSTSWLIRTSHSHSGYLELMATTGVPGLFFGLLALVVAPFVKFMHLDSSNRNIKAALYSIWIFALLFNFMETQIFTRDRQIWLMLIIVIASLRCMEYDAGGRQ